MLYRILTRLIVCGKTDGLEKKIDAFYKLNKLTETEYQELIAMLHPKEEKADV